MSRFTPDPQAFFADVYQKEAPWDVGAPQPALLTLFERFPLAEPVLDVGCGTGDLSLGIARLGHRVVGVDFVATAIAESRARALTLPPDARERVELRVADAFRPSLLGTQFGSVVDSGFYHLFDHADRDRFAEELGRTLQPGGRYYLLAFTITYPGRFVPLEVSEPELGERFAPDRGWNTLECTVTHFKTRLGDAPAICACIERTA